MATPTQQVLVRTPEAASLLSGAVELGPGGLSNIPAKKIITTSDGSRLAAINDDSVDVYDVPTSQKLGSLPAAGVLYAEFSPAGGYITTAQRSVKTEGEAPKKNIQVWDVSTRQPVLELHHKSVTKESWPCIQWSRDDSSAFHQVTNTVHVYSTASGFTAPKKVPVKGVSSFAPCHGEQKLLAAFMSESKGQPAVAAIIDYTGADPVTLVRRSFFRATSSSMMWNSKGTACLFLATSDTDATNQSYYGEAKLHYLPADANKADLACAVPVPKDGPVHDVRWSPGGECFCVVAGFMPAKVILLDERCKPVYDLGGGPYNTVRWNPFGRFLVIAGFGNLPGDIMLFDKKTSGTCKLMAKTRCEAVDCAWSPCGRYLMTATTAPRLRVDNGIKVITYYGEKVAEKKFDVLLEADWLPVPAGTFTDRPASPERVKAGATTAGGADAAARAPAYRPPTLREHLASFNAGVPAATFSLAHDADSKPGRISANSGKALPPGAEFVSKAAAKNAKKRAAKKSKAGGEEAEQDGDQQQAAAASSSGARQEGSGPSSSGAVDGATGQMAGLKLSGASGAAGADASAAGDADATQKRIRALQKKLRQIQQLKERCQKEGEGALESEQLAKIAAEADVLRELQSLGGAP